MIFFWIFILFLVLSTLGWWISKDERESQKIKCEYHEWDLKWHNSIYDNLFSMISIGHEYHYRCKKCGKIKHQIILDEDNKKILQKLENEYINRQYNKRRLHHNYPQP